MAYESHDANIIKSVLEAHCFEADDRQVREALAALARLVHDYLPEAAEMRALFAQRGRNDPWLT